MKGLMLNEFIFQGYYFKIGFVKHGRGRNG